MKKAIVLAGRGGPCDDIFKQMAEDHEFMKSEIMFLEKQAQTVYGKFEVRMENHWKELRKILGGGGLLKDYDDKIHNLSFDASAGVLFIVDRNEDENSALKNLLRRIFS